MIDYTFFTDLADENKVSSFIPQGTNEWDQIRVGRFTASEIHRLMTDPKSKADKDAGNLSETAMTYVQEKVAEVMTGQGKQQGYAFPLVWGTEKEPEARALFVERCGLEVTEVGFFTYTDHAGGSPDGLVGSDAILEIKCPYDSATQVDYLMLTDKWDLKRNFKQYYWQCQANMLFTERSRCYFVTFDPRMVDERHRMQVLEITATPEDAEALVERIGKAVEAKLKLLNLLSK